MAAETGYPVQFSVDYPDRSLSRLTTLLRIIVAIPIIIIISVMEATLLSLPVILMIVFREKYPRWWYDWNLEYARFANRVGAYLLLLRDEYPSTDEEQAVHLTFPYPDVKNDLNRWLPLVKWLLAIPHYIVLIVLGTVALLAVIIAWVAILITGQYPKSLFNYVVGVQRWSNRVTGYAFILVTDQYPPFRLSP